MKRLSPTQRGFLMGLRCARTQAQREMNEMTDRFENVIAEIHAEMRAVRVELGRLRTLDNAILAERDPTMWLNALTQRDIRSALGLQSSGSQPRC
jgi:hypothetical protein